MKTIGARLFMVLMRASMIVTVLWLWLVAPFGAGPLLAVVRAWTHLSRAMLRTFCGIDDRFVGLEKLPDGPAILAVKHQSEWETFAILLIRKNAAFILKKELIGLPLWGYYARRAGHIGVDRKAGVAALKRMTADARTAVGAGRSIVIFPEGTRRAVGAPPRYHPGIAALYLGLDVPVVPVALNSGLFWPRRGVAGRAGTIVLEILDPIKPGLDRHTFMARLETAIETATDRLVAGGQPPGPNHAQTMEKPDT